MAHILAASALLSLFAPPSAQANAFSLFRRASVNPDVFDFVIAGGGTAGLTVAARLTENPAFKVLVVEAGPPPDSINDQEAIPALDFLLQGSNLDWNFTTINQPTLNGRSFLYARGKCLGGSSVLNFMAFNRGTTSVYNLWETLGNPGWGWHSVLPYFKKSVQFTPPVPGTTDTSLITFDNSFYNASGGPLQVSFGKFVQPLGNFFNPGLQEIGVSPITDLNGGQALGVAHATTTINPSDQTRSSAYTTFFRMAKDRPNLKVITGAMVEQITFKKVGSTTVASGIKYRPAGSSTSTFALASKEVIMSTGAVQTPQLLMVSGIGPKKTLDKFKIPIIAANDGVGKRLQDHASFYVNMEVPDSLFTAGFQFPKNFPEFLQQFKANASGPFASTNGDTLGFQRFTDEELAEMGGQELIALGPDWPNIEYLMLPAYNNPGFPNPPNATGNYITILVSLVSPTSMGSIDIRSADIHDSPIIDVNYFATPVDQKVVVKAIKNALDVVQSNSFSPLFLGRDRVVPGPNITTDAQLLNYIRDVTTTIWHGAGTTPMLPQCQGGVVDSNLNVYGVKGLRVVDAGIQPRITNMHLQATVYMIAEKAADMIKAQHS